MSAALAELRNGTPARFVTRAFTVLLLGILAAGTLTAQHPAVPRIDARGIRALVADGSAKVTLVNLWATWCLPCREEMPGLLKLADRYGKAGFRLVLVSADGPEAGDTLVPPMLTKLGARVPSFVDDDASDEAMINGIDTSWSGALPASFLYDSTGALVQRFTGGKSYEAFEQALLRILR